jgi:hypothetical protein
MFFAIWKGDFDSDVDGYRQRKSAKRTAEPIAQLCSLAYPANLPDSPGVGDNLQYMRYTNVDGHWQKDDEQGTTTTLPVNFPRMSFVISTDAQKIVLTGLEDETLLTIREEHLYREARFMDEDQLQAWSVSEWNQRKSGTIDLSKLTEDEQGAWNRIRAMVVEEVALKFLFTESSPRQS